MRPRKRFQDVRKELETSRGGAEERRPQFRDNNINRISRDPRMMTSNVPAKKNYLMQRVGFIFLIFTLFVSFVYITRLSDKPIIKFVGSKNNQRFTDQTQTELYGDAKKLLDSSLFNGNKITVNISSIRDTLLAKYPEFTDINIDLPLIDDRPVITLLGSDPVFILSNGNGQYLINTRGAAILQQDSNSNLDYLNLVKIVDQTGFNVRLGSLALSNTDVSFMREVVYQLKAKDYVVSKIVLPQSTREADVYLKGAPFFIKFNLANSNPNQQAGGFLATINYLKQKNITVSQYFDVRVENRVYYK